MEADNAAGDSIVLNQASGMSPTGPGNQVSRAGPAPSPTNGVRIVPALTIQRSHLT